MQIVDAWIQHPTQGLASAPMFDSLRRWTGGWVKEGVEIPPEFSLAALDEANCSLGLLNPWCDQNGHFLVSNESVDRVIAAYPERFRGLAAVDVRFPVQAVAELRHQVENRGKVGLRVLPWLVDKPPNHRLFYPLYQACVELDVPFALQIGHTGPLRTSRWGEPMRYLEDVALEFPSLRIIGGHVGVPWEQQIISMARKFPNVFLDTSAYKLNRLPKDILGYMHSSKCKKTLFASNFPMITPSQCLAGLDSLNLDVESKKNFLSAAAQRAYKLELNTKVPKSRL